jgi:hypothetical protein
MIGLGFLKSSFKALGFMGIMGCGMVSFVYAGKKTLLDIKTFNFSPYCS